MEFRQLMLAGGLPILMFHAVDDDLAVISFSPTLFESALAKIDQHGYRTISLLQACVYLRERRPFPEHVLLITFDDGYRSVYEGAFPALRRYGMTADVFLLTGSGPSSAEGKRCPDYQGRAMLSWPEIREMHRYGISFGAHTMSHLDLTRLSEGQIEAEVRQSKTTLEQGLGAEVLTFAYPFGHYDRRSREIVRRHFRCACSDRLGLVTQGSDLYALERVDAYYLRSERTFGWLFHPWFGWYVRGRSVPRRFRRAIHWRSA